MDDSTLEKTLASVEKMLTVPTYIQPSELVRENLSSFVPRLTIKKAALRERLPRKPGSGSAAAWDLLTSMGSGNSAFAEGGTPNEDTSGYGVRSAVYKELGKKKSISDKLMAAGKSFMDQDAEQTLVGMREVIQDEEQMIVTGDPNFNPLEFAGIKKLITTNVVDDANSALGFRTDLLDLAVTNLVNQYGVIPTAIYLSWGMKRAVNQSLGGDVRVNLDQTNTVTTGLDVGFYQSAVGKLPFIPTFAIADDSSTYAGNVVSDIYVMTEEMDGESNLYLEDLYPLGKTMLARTGAAVQFMITESTVLVMRAQEFNYRLKNIRIS